MPCSSDHAMFTTLCQLQSFTDRKVNWSELEGSGWCICLFEVTGEPQSEKPVSSLRVKLVLSDKFLFPVRIIAYMHESVCVRCHTINQEVREYLFLKTLNA